jgi:hypothetical protein
MPEPDGFEYKRVLVVPEEINTAQGIVRLPKIRSVLQRYLSGMHVTGSMCGDPDKRRPDFERLENVDEVWVMCFREPNYDQWELMGRFVGFNAFVGLGFFRRAFLDGQKKYHRHAQEFVPHWAQANVGAPVHTGTIIQDYMSYPVSDPYAPSVI